MTTRKKSLPGFLRRSLRDRYEEDDESSDDEDLDTAENTAEPLSEPSEPGATEEEQQQQGVASDKESSESSDHLSGQQSTARLNSDSWQNLPTEPTPAPLAVRKKSYRESAIEDVLGTGVINLQELQKLGWNGIPVLHRATAWKLLLGYLPTNTSRRAKTVERRRKEYLDARAQHFDIDDDSRTSQEQEMLRQVLVDVPRTAPTVPLFRNDRIRRILTRLLYIWATRHPASSYVQGINDLVTPLITVFLADHFGGSLEVMDGHVMNHFAEEDLLALEADVYGCLTNLLAGIQDHYTPDQPGVQRMLMKLEELVNRIDADLCEHLRSEGIQFLQFAFKWMNCLLLREFKLSCVFRLWDTYLCEKDGFEGFHVYVCAAFLCQYSAQLQEMPFEDLFAFMQAMPTQDWTDTEIEVLLSQAYVLSTLFRGSEAHLTAAPACAR